jgi:trehalose-6-phosphatase
MKRKKIAIDFDGTCVQKAEFPKFGESVPSAGYYLRRLQEQGIELILWTCRNGQPLQSALDWFEGQGIQLVGVNGDENCTLIDRSVKIDCDFYIDDKALGCPLRNDSVHWESVWEILLTNGYVTNL